MKTKITILLIFLILNTTTWCQSVITTVEVLDRLEKQSTNIFKGAAQGVAFSLLRKSLKDTTWQVVQIEVTQQEQKEVARSRGVAVSGNLNIAIGGQSTTTTQISTGYMELNQAELKEIMDFFRWSLSKKSPFQERDIAHMLQFNERLKIALILQAGEWRYYFKIDDAEFQIVFQAGLDLLTKLNSYYKELSGTQTEAGG